MKTTLPALITLLLSVIVALSVILPPVVVVTSSVVNVGIALAMVKFVFSLVNLSQSVDPEYTACMLVPSLLQSSGTT